MKNNNKILIITANKDLETNCNKPLTLSANISERTDKIKDKKHKKNKKKADKEAKINYLFKQLIDTTYEKENIGGILADLAFCKYVIRSSENGEIYIYHKKKGIYKLATEENISSMMYSLLSEYPNIRNVIKSSHYSECYKQIKIRCGGKSKILPQSNNQPYILCKNGVVDIRYLSLNKYDKKYGLTFSVKASFNPDAKGKAFEKFIDFATNGDESLKRLLQEITGYVLSDYTCLRKAFVFQGPKGTGKSLFLDVIRSLIGINNTSSVDLQNLDDEYYRAALLGAKVNIAPDTPASSIKEITTFKSLTSELDVISSRAPYEKVKQQRCRTKLLFGTNHNLNFGKAARDDILAVFDRLIYVPFVHQVKDKDRNSNLIQELLKEKDYIFTWACIGMNRLYNNNFEFTKCRESEKMYNDALAAYCPEEIFVKEHIIVSGSNTYESSDKIRKAYIKYMEKHNISDYSCNDITNYLEKKGIKKSRKRIGNAENPIRVFEGIQLVD